jgi:hypothetical protein
MDRSKNTVSTKTTASTRDHSVEQSATADSSGAEVVVGARPDLFLDGRCRCDQPAALAAIA